MDDALIIVCFRPLRCTVYETLSVWMQSLGGASGTETYATSLIRHAVADCSVSVNAQKVTVVSNFFCRTLCSKELYSFLEFQHLLVSSFYNVSH